MNLFHFKKGILTRLGAVWLAQYHCEKVTQYAMKITNIFSVKFAVCFNISVINLIRDTLLDSGNFDEMIFRSEINKTRTEKVTQAKFTAIL